MTTSAAVRAGAMVLVAAMALAGCDEGGRVARGPKATASAPPVSPGQTPKAPKRFARTVRSVFEPGDDILRVAVQDPSSLDPMRIGDPGSVLVARQVYEGLTRWDPVERRVVPAAAQSWEASAGGRRFEFRLRRGMRFHDGTRVTASDFEFAFDRIARKENASDVAYALELVEGFKDVNQTAVADHLSGVSVRGDRTLVIQLSEPYRELPAVMTHPGLVPLSRKAVSKSGAFSREPVGNGPFRMAKPWTPGRPVVLRTFRGAFEEPELDGIRFVPFPDAAASWIPFVDGELEVAEVPAGQIASAEDVFGSAGFKPLTACYYYGFNFRLERFRDIRLRRAVSLAVDREAIADGVYKGTLQTPRGIVPRGMPGFDNDACARVCTYDPDTAGKLVSKLPRKSRSVTIEFTREVPHGRVAQALERDLEAVGLSVKLQGMSFGRYVRRLRDEDHGLYRLGWIAEYPTPDVFLSPLFESDSSNNHAGFKSDKVDGWLRKAHAEARPQRRLELYKRVERELLRRLAIVPIGQFVTHWAAAPRVEGIVFDVMGGFDAVGVSLAAED